VVARATYFVIKGRLQNNRKRGLAIVADEIHDLEQVLVKMDHRRDGSPELPHISGPALDTDEAVGQVWSNQGQQSSASHVGGGQRPARVGREYERPTYAEHKLLRAERKAAKGAREQEVYRPGTPDRRKRPPGAGTAGIPKKVG
jgi:hypothetical protein